MFQPNGVISAGKLNLQKKAVKWNDQQMRQKEERRDQIYDELREAMKLKREEFNASRLEQDINCVQKRLEFAQQTLKYHVSLFVCLTRRNSFPSIIQTELFKFYIFTE